mgnify:CR=1 FL=1
MGEGVVECCGLLWFGWVNRGGRRSRRDGWGRERGREENRSRKEVVAGRAAAGRGGGGGSEVMRKEECNGRS